MSTVLACLLACLCHARCDASCCVQTCTQTPLVAVVRVLGILCNLSIAALAAKTLVGACLPLTHALASSALIGCAVLLRRSGMLFLLQLRRQMGWLAVDLRAITSKEWCWSKVRCIK